MATKEQLKEYFSTGKIPTAAQFGELIDSSFNENSLGSPIYVQCNQEVPPTNYVYIFDMVFIKTNSNLYSNAIPYKITLISISRTDTISNYKQYLLTNNHSLTDVLNAWNYLLTKSTFNGTAYILPYVLITALSDLFNHFVEI